MKPTTRWVTQTTVVLLVHVHIVQDDFEEYSDDFEDLDEDEQHSIASSTSETSKPMARSATEQQRTKGTPVSQTSTAHDATVVERRKAELQRSDSMRASVGLDTHRMGHIPFAGRLGRYKRSRSRLLGRIRN